MRIRNLIVEDRPNNALLSPLKPEQVEVIKKYSFIDEGVVIDDIREGWFRYAILLTTDCMEDVQDGFKTTIADLSFLPEGNPKFFIPEDKECVWEFDLSDIDTRLVNVKDGQCYKGLMEFSVMKGGVKVMRIRDLIVEDKPDNSLLDSLKPEQIEVIKKYSYLDEGVVIDDVREGWFNYAIFLVTDSNEETVNQFHYDISDLTFLPEGNPMAMTPESKYCIWGFSIKDRAEKLVYVKDGKCYKGVDGAG